MGLIKNRAAIAITLFLLLGTEQWAQTGSAPRQFGAEIFSLEQKLANPGITTYERYDALVRLARLRQLSGNISSAAANWLDAAALYPNDEASLVSGAFCLTAIGEWERAYQVIQPLLTSTRRSPSVLQANYLDAYLKTWSYSNASPLVSLAASYEFASIRPTIYYTIWQILTRSPNISGAGSADTWKARLIAEYPGSPEAIIAGSRNGGAVISAVQNPMWLLFPGAPGSSPPEPTRPKVTIVQPTTMPPPVQTAPPVQVAPGPPVQIITVPGPSAGTNAPVPQFVVPAPQPAAPAPQPAPVPSPPVSAGPALQTFFGREANARAQVEALRKAGFTATVSRKIVNGVEGWAVTVLAGQNQSKTIQDLKRAGFDSFPVVNK
jgi:hypothetical protein